MKHTNHFTIYFSLAFLMISCGPKTEEAPTFDAVQLEEGFKNPPNEAKPRVWWHWMNGNVTKDGIQKDLDWMERTGIGGFQNFDANLFTPLVTDEKLVFMTPDWKEAFKFTTDLAIEKDFEMAIAGSPGWSETGGPWVEPRDGMKKYVWSEIEVQGGDTFNSKLPEPPKETSTFQNVPPETGFSMDGEQRELPQFYEDAAVIAYKIPEEEVSLSELNPSVTSSGGNFLLDALTDGNLHNGSFLPPAAVGEKTWVQYAFNEPVSFKSYSVVGAKIGSMAVFRGMPQNRSIEISDDGVTFKKLVDIPGSIVPQTTGSFPPTTAKYWRFVYKTLPPSPPGMEALFGVVSEPKPEGVDVAEFVLTNTSRVDRYEGKAGFTAWKESDSVDSGNDEDAIGKENVIDLTDKFQGDGTLVWEVPKGTWKIIRLGYSLTGRENHPASPEATGLEVDKLDEDAVRKYINHYLDLYQDATGGQMGESGLGYVILDSYEAGHMNWTHDMFEEFSSRRGYDMRTWIPVLTGRVIESREASERFLWDFRKTIGEMISDNHYDIIGEELHKRGMKRYTESHEGNRIFLADGMDVKRNADIPMSAMWTPGSLAGGMDEEVRSEGDIRESASVANIYGKPFVAAESMTSIQNGFSWHPEKLKRTADLELASGLNRFVIHTSVHQPLDDKMPGFSLGPFGQYFTRQETWSGAGAQSWISYLSRSCYLLQQGQNVADVLYLYGENDNVTHITQESLPDIAKGHEFDFVSPTILQEAISAEDGQLKALSGVRYQILQLDKGTQKMSMAVLNKLAELANAGVKIKGTKPLTTPSLSDDVSAFQSLADEIWAKPNVGENVSLDIAPDVQITETDHEILFRHRASGDSHIYWLNNRNLEPTTAKIGFRVTGKQPKLWHPQTGTISDVSYAMEGETTWVELDFESWDAYFILFAEDTDQKSLSIPQISEAPVLTLEGQWDVEFQEKRGAPASVTFDALQSWTENKVEGIKYFSGTATYRKTFDFDKTDGGASFILDLGKVKNIAEVTLNGQPIGVLWKTPFQIAITDALKNGENQLEIAVTNVWVNRLIGDAQPDIQRKITFTTMPFYQGQEPLLESGLLGEVKILRQD
ncbi:glycosyl hydrolase [Flagellimonas halotolerans]|uniref:Glycosyl hydrolase n=1 Tax=Flagellimonas halotolerans TaxID=3112164 RepID=A0ABU6IRB3_9FLAO|nr:MULTISPECIES: glycosyl hydrolase [unclassified Allomuricauda]MEC3965870.1 glycosyl hydrolase [Muricauda sp. SYSU M86414]MEC4265664.1 glycosyl hydrolase [Muricauda sp. SYSU M84420]